MMYDFEIAMPVDTGIKKIHRRVEDFKKHGLQNFQGLKIKLVLLAADGNDMNQLYRGWPLGIDIEVLSTPYTFVAQRIYEYYANHIKPGVARWYMRIDEDTVTDMAGLNDNLNLMFDWQGDYHVTTPLNWDICGTDRTILNSLGFGWWYNTSDNRRHHVTPPHEQEASVTSAPAIEKVCANSKAKEYFTLRREFATGWGDHGLCHALKMCKIYPNVVHFMSHEPDFTNLSIFGGFRNHVHWICHDRCQSHIDWLNHFNNEPEPNVENQVFLLGPEHGNKRFIYFNNKHGIQLFYQNEEFVKCGEMIGLWCKSGDDLKIYTDDSDNIIANFNRVDENSYRWKNVFLKKLHIKA